MSDANAFIKGIAVLLKETDYSTMSKEEILQVTHTAIYGVLTAATMQIGRGLTVADLAATGGRGPGGPHHWDLVLRYLTDVDVETLQRTLSALGTHD